MGALRRETEGQVHFAGIGGARMGDIGFKSLFDPRELALLGIFEVLPAYRRVLARVEETLSDITGRNPDVIVTIDSWGFTGRIHRRLSAAGSRVPRMRYVAPQVWAWRPGRARQLAQWIDHLMTLFPFEPPYFTPHGLRTTWVGHPVLESGADRGDGAAFRARHGLPAGQFLLAMLPGSRRGEVERLLPVFRRAAAILAERHGGLTIVIPTVAPVADAVRAAVADWPMPVAVVDHTEAFDAFAASRAALCASGTVSLELAVARVPHVVAYRVNRLSAAAFRMLARTKYVNLINILLDRPAVPELLQEDCTPEILASAVSPLLYVDRAREEQQVAFREAVGQLAPAGQSPSQLAARTVLQQVGRSR
jgi:lipid-A-disaccharide synthase